MEDICHRKISDTVSIAPSAMEEFCRTRRKLRKISQVQIALGVGLLLVGILVCVGTGLVLLISIPSRNDVRILIDRVESLEDTLSSLRKDIAGNDFINAMMEGTPVSMGNFMPLEKVKEMVAAQKKFENPFTTKQPVTEKPNASFSRYLIGRLNQTVSGLDEGNRLMFSKLNRSLVRLKYDFDNREDEMDRKLRENSKQLLELSNIVSRLVAKLESSDLETQVDTVIEMISALSRSSSMQTPPHPDLLKKIAATANESMVYFGSILSDEMIIIYKKLQEAITRYVDETKHHYINIDEALKTIVGHDLRIENATKNIKSQLETMNTGIDPLQAKINLLLSEQNRIDEKYNLFADSVEGIELKTEEIGMQIEEVKKDKGQLSDAARNATTVLMGLSDMQKHFVEKLENASDMLRKLLKKDHPPFDKKLDQFSTMMKDELKNALETIELAMRDKSKELSSAIKSEIQIILNRHLEKGMQIMESAMRDESDSQSSTDWKQILKDINNQFETAIKMLETKLNDESAPISKTPVSLNDTVISKVCTQSEGCTSIEYPRRRCFKVIEAAVDEATWIQAKRKCQLLGGYLAEIHNAYEYDILIKSLPTYGNYWVGGTDRGFEGYWHWDHSLLKITLNNWAPGQPNNYKYVEHCLHILHDETTVWNDLRCMSKMGYVCEKVGPNCEVWT